MFLDGDNLTIFLPPQSIKLEKLVCWLPLSWIGRRTTVTGDKVFSKRTRIVSIKGKIINVFSSSQELLIFRYKKSQDCA